jgi:hypothetical protein
MEQLVLINENEIPTEEIILSHLGRTKNLWKSLFAYIHKDHPDFNEEWRYYRDGKSWLLKVTRKKKTVCWISVLSKKFKMTFYFTDRAEPAIMESRISDELKQQFISGKHYNKIRGLTITFKNKTDLDYAKALTEIKLSVK